MKKERILPRTLSNRSRTIFRITGITLVVSGFWVIVNIKLAPFIIGIVFSVMAVGGVLYLIALRGSLNQKNRRGREY